MSIKPKNVLIVEDEVITQRYLKDVLDEQKIPVSIAVDNGDDALKHLEKVECDLILMDINIKGSMDGLRLGKRILEKHDVCIIFITAYSDASTLDEAMELSPYGFIIKPFDPVEIQATIKIGYKRFCLYKSQALIKNKTQDKVIRIKNDLAYDIVNNALLYKGIPINLSVRHVKLMGILVRYINTVVSTETIITEVWGFRNSNDVSLRTLVYGLRKFVPELPLVTHSKMGYMLKQIK